LSCCRI